MPKINLILVGNQGSGKTSFVNKYVFTDYTKEPEKMFSHKYHPTIGINLERKVIVLEAKDGIKHEVNLQIWDTAGQEKFFSLTKSYFRQADGVIIMFDVTDKGSFFKIEEFWMRQIEENCKPNTEKILIGNKIDLVIERAVDKEFAQSIAQKYRLPYFEASAKFGDGIEETMNAIAKKCLDTILNKKISPDVIELGDQDGPTADFDCLSRFRVFMSEIRKKLPF